MPPGAPLLAHHRSAVRNGLGRRADTRSGDGDNYALSIEKRPTRRLLGWILAGLLVASACSTAEEEGADDSADSTSSEPADTDAAEDPGEQGAEENGGTDPGASTPSQTAPGETAPGPESVPLQPSIDGDALAERFTNLPGRLAIGNGPELGVVRPDGLNLEILDGSETVFASQPTWSHDGAELAWSSVSAERQIIQVQAFDDEGMADGEAARSDAAGQPVFYLQWNEADDTLAYIRNAETLGLVEVGIAEPGSAVRPEGEGAPFFISWSPGPDRLLGHVNEAVIRMLTVAGTEGDPIGPGFDDVMTVDGGGFSAPAWVDGERALVVSEGFLSYLHVDLAETEPIERMGGPVRFVLSPDRTKVAYQILQGSGGVAVIGHQTDPAQPVQQTEVGLTVLDLGTGDKVVVTTTEAALAWEWSPDSDKLAWLASEPSTTRPQGRWNFWSMSGSLPTEVGPPFGLTRKYIQSYLPFFGQYTQSVTGWAPDSNAFAYAGVVGNDRGIWVQLIDEVVAPQLVASGDFVTWGIGPSPPASGAAEAAR